MNFDRTPIVTLWDLLIGILCFSRNLSLLYNVRKTVQVLNEYSPNDLRIPDRFQAVFKKLGIYRDVDGLWSFIVESAVGRLVMSDGVESTVFQRPDYFRLDPIERDQYLAEPALKDLTSEEVAFLQNLAAKINGEG